METIVQHGARPDEVGSESPQRPATQASRPYDPAYDPLVSATPGEGRDYAPTYWVATAGEPPADDGPVMGDIDADVVIVGSGFTGLTAAIVLAEKYGIKATVLEANRSAGVARPAMAVRRSVPPVASSARSGSSVTVSRPPTACTASASRAWRISRS